MTRKPLLIIQMGEPPAEITAQIGEQGDWFKAALAQEGHAITLIRPDRGDVFPAFTAIAAVIVSGSWSMVTDHLPWSEQTAAWLREACDAGVAVLGVCYGHQLLAYALGGVVADNPNGAEMGLLPVTLRAEAQQDALLHAYPARFNSYLTHRQSVLTPPPGAQVLAYSQRDGCQIIRYRADVLSVQFHPEFTAPMMLACIRRNEKRLRELGHDVDAMLQLAEEPLWARRLLLDFARHYG